MHVSDRPKTSRSPKRISVVLILLAAVAHAGCTASPVRALRGARHYAAGTEALERHQNELAIRELERAAYWVPHASEIQNHLGLAYWADGRVAEARVAFERSVELDCQNEAARSNLERLVRSGDASLEVATDARASAAIGTDDDGG